MKKKAFRTPDSSSQLESVQSNKQFESSISKILISGKHRYTTMIGDDEREYYVHVPNSYDHTKAFPVVIMLHGSGSNGEDFYNCSGWKEVGEKENILTVFPSAWKYNCVIDDGTIKKNAEKWTNYDLVLCENDQKRDDIKFLSTIIHELKQKFLVDKKRIYLVGFSSGGKMASRCAIELSDQLAALVACSGFLPRDIPLVPLRKVPIMAQIGAADPGLLEKLNSASPLPMNIKKVLTNYPLVQDTINAFLRTFDLMTTYTISGNPKKYTAALYKGRSVNSENVFKFAIVKGLKHQYANGIDHENRSSNDHPFKSAEVHWEWLKEFSLP